jgi:hypothetical protein
MTRKLTSLTAALAALVAIIIIAPQPNARAAANTPLITVDALASKTKAFAGKTIVLHGVVDRVSKERRMITLIDPSEANCTDACQRNTVIVPLPATNKDPLPEARREVLVHGSVDPKQAPLRMIVTRIVTDPAQIKEALAANKKR